MSHDLAKAVKKAREKLFVLTRPFKDEGFIIGEFHPARIQVTDVDRPRAVIHNYSRMENIEVVFTVRIGKKTAPAGPQKLPRPRKFSRYDILKDVR